MGSDLKLYEGGAGELLFDWARCTKCPLHENRKRPVHGWGDPKAKVVFILDRIGPKAAATGNLYEDLGGRALLFILKELSTNRHNVWCTAPTLCPTKSSADTVFGRPLDSYPPAKASDVSTCQERLHKEINLVGPEIIVVCGSAALKALAVKNPPNYTSSLNRIIDVHVKGEFVSYAIPTLVLTSLELLARDNRQNTREIWNKTKEKIRLAISISEELKKLRRD